MEGVMMRNGDVYGLAVRRSDGSILAQRHPWFSLTRAAWLKKPFMRGFPALLETLVNGIKALNYSVEAASQSEQDEISGWQLVVTLLVALLMAIGLFVLAPHLLSVAMLWLGLGGDVEGLSFHLWDGFFKACIFMAYIKSISLFRDIRRVFQYHGAEHKTIHAWESQGIVDVATAANESRLHPRCGTTFLLFVIALSIILHAVFVPLLLALHTPQWEVAKHILVIGIKLALVVPISALSYELIRYSARLPEGMWARVLRAPGLMLQRLTTFEPDGQQLEVAIVALREALGPDGAENVHTVPYTLENSVQ